jgi:hypothetical protein
MAFLSLIVAVFIFLIGALAPIFTWDLGSFSPLFWGLFFFAFSFLAPTVISYTRRP